MKISELMRLDMERLQIKQMLEAIRSAKPNIFVNIAPDEPLPCTECGEIHEYDDGDDVILIQDKTLSKQFLPLLHAYLKERLFYIDAIMKEHKITYENKSHINLVTTHEDE